MASTELMQSTRHPPTFFLGRWSRSAGMYKCATLQTFDVCELRILTFTVIFMINTCTATLLRLFLLVHQSADQGAQACHYRERAGRRQHAFVSQFPLEWTTLTLQVTELGCASLQVTFGWRPSWGTPKTVVGSKTRDRKGSIISIDVLRSPSVWRWRHACGSDGRKKRTRTSFYILFFFFNAAAGRSVEVAAAWGPRPCRPRLEALCLPFEEDVELFSFPWPDLGLFVDVVGSQGRWRAVDDWVARSFASCPVRWTVRHYPFGLRSCPAIVRRSRCWPGRWRWALARTWPIAERRSPALLFADHDELAWCCASIDTYVGALPFLPSVHFLYLFFNPCPS